ARLEPRHVVGERCEPVAAELARLPVDEKGRADLDDEALGILEALALLRIHAGSSRAIGRSAPLSVLRLARIAFSKRPRASATPVPATPESRITFFLAARARALHLALISAAVSASHLLRAKISGFRASSSA